MQNVALVTGASRGIGRGIAVALAQQGFHVVGTATSQSGADKLTEVFKAEGLSGQGVVLDVAEAHAIDTFMSNLAEMGLAPSVLVNNAGITQDTLLLRMRDEDWQRVLDVNLTAIYRLSKAALRPMMKARFGRIVNVTSVVAQTGSAGQCNYAAAKAGIVGFTKSLAREVGSRGITINAVAPGFIDTDMTSSLAQARRDELLAQIPLGRLGTVDEVAATVVFLVSPGAAYITGETLSVNGGLYMA